MKISASDRQVLRELAERYSAIAHEDVQQERLERYRKTIALEDVRPVVLINEVPWGELNDDALTTVCAPELKGIETRLRRTIYQWEHFQVDTVVPPVFSIGKQVHSTGIGLHVQDTQMKADTGSDITSHEYVDQLQNEDDIAKLKEPVLTYDKEGTEANVELAKQVFDGLLEVRATGNYLACNLWDQISMYRGVDSLLMDLAMRPEFMHQIVQRFAEIAESDFRQREELGLLEPNLSLVHCTVAHTDELPGVGADGKVTRQNVWGRCAAQIFGSVSPKMHDEFDLEYNQKLFQDCGLLYYGCCEPMDAKVDILRKRFKNLRKISITPWANPDRAADNIGSDYVMAAKPNPAFVASPTFNPETVKQEITGYCEAAKRNGTTLEFVLKDISTVSNDPTTLTKWAETVKSVLDKYYD